MLYSGKKIRALRDKKNKYSNSRVFRKKFSERNKKTYPPPPLQVKWSVPYCFLYFGVHNWGVKCYNILSNSRNQFIGVGCVEAPCQSLF